MRINNAGFTIGLVFFCSLIYLSCSTDKPALISENRLSQSELSYYSDSFDSLKDDLWDKAGYVFSLIQLENIRIGEMSFEAGKLRLDTKTGGFSKAGLVSKFALRGNYAVEIDFQIDFKTADFEMDQILGLGAVEKSGSGTIDRLITIGLGKKANSATTSLYSGYRHGGRYHSGFSRQIDNFNGSLKIVRIGDRVSTFFRKKNRNRWAKMCEMPSSQKDTFIGFALSNFASDRKAIEANRSISAWIDNFKIITAEEIIESEI